MKLTTPLKLAGPGTIAMIICLILLVGWNLLRPSKVRIERKVEASGEPRFERKPDPSLLLQWKDHLSLSSSQIAQLERIERERQRELAPINAAINETMSPLQSTKGQSAGKIDKLDIGQLTAIASQIKTPSRQLRALEVSFSEQGWSILGPVQRRQALKLKLALSKSVHAPKEAIKP